MLTYSRRAPRYRIWPRTIGTILELEKFMVLKSHVLVMGFVFLFSFSAAAEESGNCSLSSASMAHAQAINSLLQGASLWRSYPAGFTFGLADFDSNGSIYLLKNSVLANQELS